MPSLSTPGVYVEEVPSGSRAIAGVPTSVTAFIGRALSGPVDEAVPLRSYIEFERTFGGLWMESSMSFAVMHYFLNGGQQAIVVRVADGTEEGAIRFEQIAAPELETQGRGLWALNGAPFNILCIPPFEFTVGVDLQTWQAALDYVKRRRAMLLLDPPHPKINWGTPDQIIDDYQNGRGLFQISDSHAALYFPWLQMPNPLNNDRLEFFAPCGAVAGMIARSDAKRGVWKAPAGLEAQLQGVKTLAYQLNGDEMDRLSPIAVNCLRSLPDGKHVAWGARTMAGAAGHNSEWKYIPIRRLALHIEESLDRGLAWVVFEPNDEPLWAQIRSSVGHFMNSLYRQGAFQGQSPRDAYFVKCDRTTTAPVDIERGFVNVLVGFAPLKPAEFVILTIRQEAGQMPA